MDQDSRFGFIVIDGNGALFGTLSGNTREVVHKFGVDLPKKHGTFSFFSSFLFLFPPFSFLLIGINVFFLMILGRGGQSALRFARLRMEKRHNYLRKVAELATQFFITNDRVEFTF